MDSTKKPNKYSYYTNFTSSIFLGAKELLKSMPAFYNKVYFSIKFAKTLWGSDTEESFSNVTLLADAKDIDTLRQIIKNNFLYINDWDSVKYTTKGDYGFSFIAGNIKYIILPFTEFEEGYIIRSYDVGTGDCYDTTFTCDKELFLDSTMNSSGEFIRVADFTLEYMTNANTKVEKAPKKAQELSMATYTPQGGYAFVNLIAVLLLSILGAATVYLSYYVVSHLS